MLTFSNVGGGASRTTEGCEGNEVLEDPSIGMDLRRGYAHPQHFI